MEVPAQALIDAGFTPEDAKGIQPQKGRGCGTCNNTGYKGRVGLYEVFQLTDEVRQLVLEGASSIELKARAMEDGMIWVRLFWNGGFGMSHSGKGSSHLTRLRWRPLTGTTLPSA